MTRKINEQNERIKRLYLAYLRDAKRCDMITVDRAADAILKFETSTSYKSIFHTNLALCRYGLVLQIDLLSLFFFSCAGIEWSRCRCV